MRTSLPQTSHAVVYAAGLLHDLNAAHLIAHLPAQSDHPAIAWARAGLPQVCGFADSPALICPAPIASHADGAIFALNALAVSAQIGIPHSGAVLLGERARLLKLSRQGRISAGGACHLLPTANGWLAANLPRQEDIAALPALLEDDTATDLAAAASIMRSRDRDDLIERARLLGLAIAPDPASPPAHAPWFTRKLCGPISAPTTAAPRVVDLSSLWAGPLAGQLLSQLGADVIKVESTQRPDGARAGNAAFFDRLNGSKSSVTLDLSSHTGRQKLRALIHSADIVIESARPRALRQMGIVAEDMVAQRPGLTWVAISGYGRAEGLENAPAFGDDAAVAAGLTRLLRLTHARRFFGGDAIGDPLTGMHAAAAAWASWQQGGGTLITLALADVTAHAIGDAAYRAPAALRQTAKKWRMIADVTSKLYDLPQAAMARPNGGDTTRILQNLKIAC